MLVGIVFLIIGEKWAQQRGYIWNQISWTSFLNKFLLYFLDTRSIVEFCKHFVEIFKSILHAC